MTNDINPSPNVSFKESRARSLLDKNKRQYQLYQEGLSQLDGHKRPSRHQSGHAIDFVAYDENNKVTLDFKYYEGISKAFKQAARELEVSIIWDGEWKSHYRWSTWKRRHVSVKIRDRKPNIANNIERNVHKRAAKSHKTHDIKDLIRRCVQNP